MYIPRPAKLLFTVDDGWNRYLASNGERVTPWTRLCVERMLACGTTEMIGRYISHIPAKHFKKVRYYGFLSNRKRGELLPKVYEALQMEVRKKPAQPGFAALMKAFLHTDPYKCILCGNRLRFVTVQNGRHASVLVAERLHSIDRKRWLRAQAAG